MMMLRIGEGCLFIGSLLVWRERGQKGINIKDIIYHFVLLLYVTD